MPTAPTLVQAVFNTAASAITVTTTSVSWQTGDVVVCIYGNEGSAADGNVTPTNTGSGLSWAVQQTHTASSNCGASVSTAVASSSSSGTITCGTTSTTQGNFIGVYIWRNSAGVGNSTITATPSSTKTVSLTPAGGADAAICWGVFDWNGDAAQTETPTATSHNSSTPGPSATPQKTQVAGHYTYHWCEFDDQTSAGAVSYGIGGSGTGPFTIVALEVQGGAGGGPATSGPLLTPGMITVPSTVVGFAGRRGAARSR